MYSYFISDYACSDSHCAKYRTGVKKYKGHLIHDMGATKISSSLIKISIIPLGNPDLKDF